MSIPVANKFVTQIRHITHFCAIPTNKIEKNLFNVNLEKARKQEKTRENESIQKCKLNYAKKVSKKY